MSQVGIREFFKDKTVFITGGSGFMGKVLIEKLLYSCSDLKEIILLMRPKRGKTGEQRVQEFAQIPVSISVENVESSINNYFSLSRYSIELSRRSLSNSRK